MSRIHAVVMADPDGRITHWNPGAEPLFGYAPAEALGQSLDLIVPPEFRERHWEGFRQAVATRSCKLDGQAVSIPVRCKDGGVQPFPGRFVFLRGARDDVVGFAALYSERTGAEQPFGPVLPL
jgi:PAS domain S-box-containing protein